MKEKFDFIPFQLEYQRAEGVVSPSPASPALSPKQQRFTENPQNRFSEALIGSEETDTIGPFETF